MARPAKCGIGGQAQWSSKKSAASNQRIFEIEERAKALSFFAHQDTGHCERNNQSRKILAQVVYRLAKKRKQASSSSGKKHSAAMIRAPVLWGCIVLVAMTAFLYLPTLQGDYDMWWHLRYGEQYLLQHSWHIDHSSFSWTPARSDWKYGTWLGSTTIYLVYRGFSIGGLLALRWLIMIAIVTLLLLYLRIAGDSLDATHILWLTLLLFVMRVNSTYIKPDRFSDLFFTMLLFIYFQAKLSGKNLFPLFPLIFLFWVNVHGGFVVGIAVISVLLIGETINLLAWKKTQDGASLTMNNFAALLLCVLLSFAALLLNPDGYAYPLALLKEYTTAGSAVHTALRSLREWAGLWDFLLPDRNHAFFPFVSAAWSLILMALVSVITAVKAFKKVRYADFAIILLNCVIFVLSMKANRAALYFPITAFFSIIYMLKKSGSLEIKRHFQGPSIAIIAMSAVTMLFLVALEYGPVDRQASPGHDFVPEKECEFIRKHRLPEPIFNDYLTGGYLIWALYPDYRVFIDPRQGPYEPDVIDQYFSFSESADPVGALHALRSRFPFRTAIIHRSKVPILGAFLKSPEWKMVYFERNAVVFVDSTLYNGLPEDARKVYLGADRFADIRNPMILDWLYGMYGNRREAEKIYEIYRNNVSDLYIYKSQILHSMDQNLKTLQ
jgi:hypothetical protein